MSDRKADPKPAPKNDPDAEPLKDTEVDVKAAPGGSSKQDQENAEKVVEKVKKNVEGAIEKAKSGGAKKQLDAADEEVDKARDSVPRRAAKKLRVTVRGTDGHGDKVSRSRHVTPREGGKKADD